MNDLAAAGGRPIGLELSLMLPEEATEQELRDLMKQIEALCEREGVEIVGGHTGITPGVPQTVISMTAFGRMEKWNPVREAFLQTAAEISGDKDRRKKILGQIRPKTGDALILAGWIGLEGTAVVTREHKEALAGHYTDAFLMGAEEMEHHISVKEAARLAYENGGGWIYNCSEGGIFGALWEFSEFAGLGFDIDLKKISVKQETIEICEFLKKNPYELASGGAILIGAKDGEAVCGALLEAGIPVEILGCFTQEKGKILRNEEEIRYLDRPAQDAVWTK